MKSKIKILIVDDSAFMRKSLSILLTSDKDIEIIGTAKNGLEAVEMVKQLKPDLVTLDIEMPVMDGLTALEKIMKESPVPVIMVSSLTTEGADSTMKALELGALDFIPKEMSFVSVKISEIKDDLIRKIKTIVRERLISSTIKRLQRIKGIKKEPAKRKPVGEVRADQLPPAGLYRAIALGVSTGGPLSLQKVIPFLSADKVKCPMFIVQHMPPKFTKSLSDRLNDMSSLHVKEAEDNEKVKNGTVYIAPGGYHMIAKKNSLTDTIIRITDKPEETLHRPSVDVMVESVVDVYGKNTLGVIMTGMGKDGLEGIRKIKSLGGYVLVQDEDSCVVYGMPKAIVDAGLADTVIPLEKIAESINRVM